MQEPSGGDCSGAPTAGGIHPRSSRVAWLYAELESFPDTRNRDTPRSPDGRTCAPTQQEWELPQPEGTVQADQELYAPMLSGLRPERPRLYYTSRSW